MSEPEKNLGKQSRSAIEKSLELLELLGDSEQPLSLQELSQKLGRPKQTLHRHLQQLEGIGLINRDLSGRAYQSGPRLFALASATMGAAFRRFPRHLILQRLVDQIGESCNIGVLDQASVLYLDRVECEWPLRWHLQPGSRVPIHSTSLGKMLLAELPAPQRRRLIHGLDLERFSEKTITDPARLEEECREIRAQGFATNNQESHAGLISVAVPIVIEPGQPATAGLSIHAPMLRMSLESAKGHLKTLRLFAEELADDWKAGLSETAPSS